MVCPHAQDGAINYAEMHEWTSKHTKTNQVGQTLIEVMFPLQANILQALSIKDKMLPIKRLQERAETALPNGMLSLPHLQST